MTGRANGEGSLFFNATKQRWCGDLFVDGKRRRVSAKTKTDAKKLLDRLRRTTEDGGSATDGNMTVAVLLTAWREKALSVRGLSPASLEQYDWAIAVLKAELGKVRLRELNEDVIERALKRRATAATPKLCTANTTKSAKTSKGKVSPCRSAALAGSTVCGAHSTPPVRTGLTGQAVRPLGERSLKKLRSTMAQALQWAKRRRLVTQNVALQVELPAAVKPKEMRSLTADQAKALMAEAADDRLSALWTAMLMCGLRPGEAAGLYWEDVDFAAGVIHVRRTLKVIAGKVVVTDSVKTKASRRSLGAPKPVLDALATQFSKQTDEREVLGGMWAGTQPLVFTTTVGTPLDPSKIRRAFKSLAKRAGVGDDWHPHELRHSNASLLSAAGVPIEQISDLLGHSESRTTERTYRHELAPSISHGKAAMEHLFN